MPNYRRVKIKGGTYFFTIVTNRRLNIFSSPHFRALFNKSLHHVQTYHPFILIAYCILPDHIHLLLRLPENDDDYSMRIKEIKKRFAKLYNLELRPLKEQHKQVNLWQNRFWEHYIRDEEDLSKHIDYIHFNPVKHNLVRKVKDWSGSSFLSFVHSGYYNIEWGQGELTDDELNRFGE